MSQRRKTITVKYRLSMSGWYSMQIIRYTIFFKSMFKPSQQEGKYDSPYFAKFRKWKCLPTHTLAFKSEHHAASHISTKERITILRCSNIADNLKLRFHVIGKSKKPRSFKGSRKFTCWLFQPNTEGWMN